MNLLASLLGFSLLVTRQLQPLRQVPLCSSKSVLETSAPANVPRISGDPRNKLNSNHEKDIFRPDYIAHNAPKSTYLILNSPAIASFVLVKGWSPESLASLTNAVNTVVLENRVLTGKATCPQNWWKDPQIGIQRGTFLPKNHGGDHSFVNTIDVADKLPTLEGLETAEELAYIDKRVAPLVGRIDSTLQQIHSESPLFDVKVVLLPDNYACIYTKMSHCIGDLVTYYEILDQISSIDKGEELRPINWDNPMKAKHEIFPDSLSKRDLERLYGVPFLIGIASHVPTMPFRRKKYLLLQEDKIKLKRAEYTAKGCKGVSSNDIITAALCDANRSTDIFALTRSMRGVTHGLGLRDGGNLHCEIPFQRCAGRNPLVIKDILEKGNYFEPDEVPIWESFTGRVGRISNCVAPMNRISFGGCKPLIYCPSKSFLDFTPLDTAIIFRVCKGQTAVLHNFQHMDDSKLLNDLSNESSN